MLLRCRKCKSLFLGSTHDFWHNPYCAACRAILATAGGSEQ